MKILFVCHHLPYAQAPHSGGLDIYHYLASLSELHEVSLISFVTPEEARHTAAVRPLCRYMQTVPLNHSWAARLGRGLLRFVYPMQVGFTMSTAYRRALCELADLDSFDIVHCVAPWMAQYHSSVPDAAWVLDEVDIYSQVAWQAYTRAQGINRLYAGFEWWKLARYELQTCRRMEAIVARSRYDQEWLQMRVSEVPIEILPPWFEGFDTLLQIPPQRPPGNALLFMGAMNRPSNVEAVLGFIREIFPLVQAKVPDARLWIVGGGPPPEILQLASSHIKVTGYVEDLTGFYQQAAVVIAPLYKAGGIIVKVLNGMAAARPVVATSVANNGVGAASGEALAVADRAEDFAAEVVNLLADTLHWHHIAHGGRQFIETHYAWPQIIHNLESLYAVAVARKRNS